MHQQWPCAMFAVNSYGRLNPDMARVWRLNYVNAVIAFVIYVHFILAMPMHRPPIVEHNNVVRMYDAVTNKSGL